MFQQAVKEWVTSNEPQGIEKLSVAAGVSPTLVREGMKKGKIPKSPAIRKCLSLVLAIPETELFPNPARRKTN